MLKSITKFTIGAMLTGALSVSVWAQAPAAPPAPAWASGEELLGIPANNEKDPVKQLQLLQKWEQQFPSSAFKDIRTRLQLNAESQIATPAFGKPAGPVLDAGMKAAKDILDHADAYFAPGVKPDAMTPEAWTALKAPTLLFMHSILAWGEMTQKNDAAAEAEMRKVLTLDPNQAQMSYWLGTVIYRSKNLARFPEAFYHIARAIALGGPTPLDAATKAAATKFLTSAYAGFHGTTPPGLPELTELAVKSPFPPADFKILNLQELQVIAQGDRVKWEAEHPDLAFWEKIRDAVKASPEYFASIKEVAFPPEGQTFRMFKATVIEQPSPKELKVNIDDLKGDAILTFDDPLKPVDAGTAIEFKGMVLSYTPDPYILTMNIIDPKTDITGLPADVFAAPAGAKPAGPKKAAPKAAPKAGAKSAPKAAPKK